MRTKFLLLLMFVAGAALAQVHQVVRSVGPDGRVNTTDVPPPSTSTPSNSSPTNLPYELAQTVKNMPVTLYSQDKCEPCLNARNFLMKNGIPFSEKTVNTSEELSQFNKTSGTEQVPVLFVGSHKLIGFNSNEWRETLSWAGYPADNLLPPNYQFAPPQPLIAPQPSVNQAAPAESVSRVPPRDPNGFQF